MTAENPSLRILVTGGSAGLGAAIAGAAAARGHRVLAGGRRFAAPQQSLKSPNLFEMTLDVSDQASCSGTIHQMTRLFGGVDVVVANAGVACAGPFEEISIDEFERVMEVNFFGAVRIAKAALPTMREARSGLIMAVSSLSGLIGLPGDSAYAASKHALEGAFESLSAEVARFGIRVALIEPGGVATELMESARHPSRKADSPYGAFNNAIRNRSSAATGADPSDIAEEIVSIIESRDGALRHPVGDQARSVVRSLSELTGEARAAFARKAAGMEWWLNPEETRRPAD